ncbi:hypothetical protein AB0D90_23530 [Streptomyces althioticus]|uniref:hypothetical protein n=1 Tax=Streptomyces althioticus TaxID=83380 RepID=UPI0033E2D1CE
MDGELQLGQLEVDGLGAVVADHQGERHVRFHEDLVGLVQEGALVLGGAGLGGGGVVAGGQVERVADEAVAVLGGPVPVEDAVRVRRLPVDHGGEGAPAVGVGPDQRGPVVVVGGVDAVGLLDWVHVERVVALFCALLAEREVDEVVLAVGGDRLGLGGLEGAHADAVVAGHGF